MTMPPKKTSKLIKVKWSAKSKAKKTVKPSKQQKRVSNEGRENRAGNSTDSSVPNAATGLISSPSKKLQDSCCWICHRVMNGERGYFTCITCPRIYHPKCLTSSHQSSLENKCAECRAVSVEGALPLSTYNKPLSKLLLLVLKPIIEKYPSFKTWPDDQQDATENLCNPMNLLRLKFRIKSGDYKSTARFYSDAKWIYHNAYIVRGPKHPFTVKAKGLLVEMKTQLINLETCVDCFYNLNTDESLFVHLCHNIHKLAWVKLKGHPCWPAKVLKVLKKKAYVVYFGSHERSKVPDSDCYPLTEGNPGRLPTSLKKMESYDAAVEELQLHIQHYEERFNTFPFAENPGRKRKLPTGKNSKKKKCKTTESFGDQPIVVAPSQSVTQNRISDSEVTSSVDESDCEIIEEVSASAVLAKHFGSTSRRRHPTVLVAQAAQSIEIPGVEMEFSVGESSQAENINYDCLIARSSDHRSLGGATQNNAQRFVNSSFDQVEPSSSEADVQVNGMQNASQSEREEQPSSSSSSSHSSAHSRNERRTQRISPELSYNSVMSKITPIVRDLCNEFAIAANDSLVIFSQLEDRLSRCSQENEELRSRYSRMNNEKQKMKSTVDRLVFMYEQRVQAMERKKEETENRVQRLEAEERRLALALELKDKTVEERDSDDEGDHQAYSRQRSAATQNRATQTTGQVQSRKIGSNSMPPKSTGNKAA